MEPTQEQLTALGNYRDIIIQHASKVAEAIGVSPQTLTGWTEGNGEPTSEQAAKILEFLKETIKIG
jgi:transcriptional regulator with XRE-family HTH domain